MSKVRVRYAPSPTGHLHIGGARTALFNYLYAKHHDGDFVLRIEDTDIARNVEHGELNQIEGLEWMGAIADESPLKPKEEYAPYRQMERLDMYNKVAQKLLDEGYAYKCFCTTEELEEDYQKQKDAGYASTRYNLKCFHLDPHDLKEKEEQGLPYTIRLHVPEDEVYEFEDIIRGHVSFESKDMGDWVIVKANGIPTYNFAVVIDDHTMDITHVFRGEEHLSNTPKQMMIYDMLGWTSPQYGHMTLIVNEDHKKLSKRDETIMQFIGQYKDAGYLPEAMFNFLALLGWSPEGEEEIFSKEELVQIFDDRRLSKSPSMFDKSKLTWINKEYMKKLSDQQILELVRPYVSNINKPQEWIDRFILLYRDQIGYGQDIQNYVHLFLEEPEMTTELEEVLNWETTPVVAQAMLDNLPEEWTLENIKEAFNEVKATSGVKGKNLFMGLRVVTSHQNHGPDLMSTLYLLGKDKIKQRLEDYVNKHR